VAEWEEPRHSGRLVLPRYPTSPHSATRFPTVPSDGARTGRGAGRFLALWSGFSGVGRGGAGRRKTRRFRAKELKWAQACMQNGTLVVCLRSAASYRNRPVMHLLGDA